MAAASRAQSFQLRRLFPDVQRGSAGGGLRLSLSTLRRFLDGRPLADFAFQPGDPVGEAGELARLDEQAVRQRACLPVAGDADQIGRARQAGGRLHLRRSIALEYQPRPRLFRVVVQDSRANQSLLREEGAIREEAPRQVLELVTRQLSQVVRVRLRAGRGVDLAVRRADDQPAARTQDAARAVEESLVVGEMLERLERDQKIHRGIGERDIGGAAPAEIQIVADIGAARMRDRFLVQIDPDHRACDLRQQR